jgi:hypothetical protein
MKFKFSCPSCGKRPSRWRLCVEPVIYYRCRSCGAKFRTTASGWAAVSAVVALQAICYVLYRTRVVSPYAAISFVVIITAMAVWFMPYFMPAKLQPSPDSENQQP